MHSRLYPHLGVSSPFDASHQLVTSPAFSPPILASIRLVFALYTLFTLIFTLVWEGVRLHDASGYFSYFTELSYIGLCAYFWASGVQTLFYARGDRQSYLLQKWSRPLQFLHVLLGSTTITFPFLVTIVFWAVLSDSSTFATTYDAWSNTSLHALNTAFALFEIILTNRAPPPWLHLPLCILILGAYLGVAYITHATQGFYSYAFLNPNTQGPLLAAYIVGIAAGQCLIFVIVWGCCRFRQYVVARWCLSSSRTASDMDVEEGIDDWETVERPKTAFANADGVSV